jgi:hypothetical protein
MYRSHVWTLCLLVSLVAIPPLHAREGFGMSKRAVELDRRVPPDVLLVADTIDVRLAERSGNSAEARRLRDLIEEKMISYDARLTVEREQPALILTLDLREAIVDESWKQKTEYQSRQVGTKTETDSKGKTKEKPVYKSVPVEVNYKDVIGSVVAEFRIVDSATEEEIHSGSSSAKWNKSYKQGDGAPMRSELEKTLIDRVASEISAKLVGAVEPIKVLIPRGSFDKLVAVAEQGNWELYLQQVESSGALKGPADEAYRQYALGVAKEALAYRATEERETLDLLQAAAEHYGNATTLNPREKLFTEGYTSFWSGAEASSPIERVQVAMVDYERLADYRAELAAGRSPRRAPASASVAPAGAGGASPQTLTNAGVIALAKAGLADENIILAIDGAQAFAFDLSTDGLVGLAHEGVSPAVVAHMQKKQR